MTPYASHILFTHAHTHLYVPTFNPFITSHQSLYSVLTKPTIARHCCFPSSHSIGCLQSPLPFHFHHCPAHLFFTLSFSLSFSLKSIHPLLLRPPLSSFPPSPWLGSSARHTLASVHSSPAPQAPWALLSPSRSPLHLLQ